MTRVYVLGLFCPEHWGWYDFRASQVRDIPIHGFQDKQKKRIEERDSMKIGGNHKIR
jgi:hypothetical protein